MVRDLESHGSRLLVRWEKQPPPGLVSRNGAGRHFVPEVPAVPEYISGFPYPVNSRGQALAVGVSNGGDLRSAPVADEEQSDVVGLHRAPCKMLNRIEYGFLHLLQRRVALVRKRFA